MKKSPIPMNCGCLFSHSHSSPISFIPVHLTAIWTCSGRLRIAWTTWITLCSASLFGPMKNMYSSEAELNFGKKSNNLLGNRFGKRTHNIQGSFYFVPRCICLMQCDIHLDYNGINIDKMKNNELFYISLFRRFKF